MSRYIAEKDKPIGNGHTLLIEVPVDATDVFSQRQVVILSYILENTPEEVVDDLAKKYRVTSTRIVMEMHKIYKKLNVDEENSKNYNPYNEEVK